MAYQTSTEQILLLNNLLYFNNTGPVKTFLDEGNEGMTVGEYVDRVLNNGSFDFEQASGDTMTAKEYKELLTAVKNDNTLSRLVIEDVHIDQTSGAGGKSALFVDPVSNEAIVAFKGTEAAQEWADNFSGVSATDGSDGVSTELQESALKWYQDKVKDGGYSNITVTGHSKGGNKAKYITLMDDSVDRCISHDGQGFSDEFVEKYADNIAKNQYKITNHNTDNDFVNILLNDVGDTHYYKGNKDSFGQMGFAENHAPNAFMFFDENGGMRITETKQEPGMKELDLMLNSYIRSVPKEDRQKTGAMLAEVINLMYSNASDDEKLNKLVELFAKEKYRQESANLLAYILDYKSKYPQVISDVKRILNENGMGSFVDAVNKFDEISSAWYFNTLVWCLAHFPDATIAVAEFFKLADVPDWVKKLLKDHPEILELLKSMLDARGRVDPDRESGKDIVIESTHQELLSCSNRFSIDPVVISTCCKQLQGQGEELLGISRRILSDIIPDLDYTVRLHVKATLLLCGVNTLRCAGKVNVLGNTLEQIDRLYVDTEEKVAAGIMTPKFSG